MAILPAKTNANRIPRSTASYVIVIAVVSNVGASFWSCTARDVDPLKHKPYYNVFIYAATPTENTSDFAEHDSPTVPLVGLSELQPVPQMDSDSLESPRASCPANMRFVEGMHCPMPVHECLEFLSVERDRCKEYAPKSPCVGTPSPMRFCIDDFEYPNRNGEKPMVRVTYLQAKSLCAQTKKRLCTATEWELACEGPERLPYPTGFRRDSNRCNFDRPNIVANLDALANPLTSESEFARVDQREPSGMRPDCVSFYGVHDMAGNVDEWVLNERGHLNMPPFRSALKGGYWGRVRNRCRPTTTDHNEWHSGYQVGFRCCSDVRERGKKVH
jgi:hypothetical protein